ncbi:hypothetical protein CO134_03545 [Candidatus Kuenenbacteria bacterium CG_4_9_14_3_um_filter_39_14]|uniref:Peptidase C39-like domain-containing protein n=6 Tax=Candidatus Kueneniibacteriota TaxID=1752740 RepID=A0A2M7IKY6_9BACT|nr:hypothetical protein [Candidatus Kuenenbacteria bacterium]OIP56207.1 MAG: hypothetical protein AUK13_01520 [Candidatus Kuenenbacteria bacterium CG2_30_39_24]PIP75972.1 MAG: hypothetical protein COW86_00750 [Candidatus Kuenenbacteria bacterium CG22_combo_CG10-13_8_21_14_all_39_9]PIR80630.1 MAG: hypothetical protein COU24_02920 [Candidatus Kuenenbacteria bacterium CG10_big_fil_rev_8_21_14_0_10_39_14]PIW95509.1 MAG: hypothetical protein COZ84_03080 [Candidatus Kuenenbacteria bacterium CG_4_8_14
MEFYKKFFLALGLIIPAFILCFGFWLFNSSMFENIIFSNNKPRKEQNIPSRNFDNNPVRLEVKIEEDNGDKNKQTGSQDKLPDNREVDKILTAITVLDVPFTPQAPHGEWDNPIYQDACEETSALMAIYWLRGKSLTKTEANRKIVDLANWQTENYGEYRDTSAADTVERIFKGYFGYEDVQAKKNISLQDIIDESQKGKLVIVPANGRALANPYYTAPGPERHNLVIRGYDQATDEFITNDPGTSRGELYRYRSAVLFNAIRDYSTGYHLPIEGIEKNMIVVSHQ